MFLTCLKWLIFFRYLLYREILIDLNTFTSILAFKIIRMGAVESMHQEVQKVCLSEVARNNESLWNDEAISGKEQWIAETQALSSTNVIASTLSSSYTDRMASAFT